MSRVRQSRIIALLTGITLFVVSFVVMSPAAKCGDLVKTRAKGKLRAKHFIVERKILPEAPPEAGVKLLIGILKRIGNTPQIALQHAQQNRLRTELSQQQNQIFNQNATDPALAIRPKVYNYPTRKQYRQKNIANGKLIAAKPRNEREPLSDSFSKGLAGNHPSVRTYGRMSKESEERMKKSAQKLYNLTSALSNLQRRDTNAYVAKQQMNNRKIISASSNKTAGATRGTLIAKYPKVVDYRKSEGGSFDKSSRMGGYAGSEAAGAPISADEDAAEKKLDQPAYYKHLKEYGDKKKESAPPAESSYSKGRYSNMSPFRSTFGRRTNQTHLAYIPPNLYSGVPGLRLNATKNSVESFMRKYGNILKSEYSGWDVWVLQNKKTRKTSLQVYMRNGRVEAFRIFDSQFVPPQLKVSLDTDLETMKEKFGEPAFILKEPPTAKNNPRGVKNYVYPVSQVSFQLARSNGKDHGIKIKSVFLFKFL